MSGSRITAANEALKIFMRSLPTGCRFTIVGFGSTADFLLDHTGSNVIAYNEESMNIALDKI